MNPDRTSTTASPTTAEAMAKLLQTIHGSMLAGVVTLGFVMVLVSGVLDANRRAGLGPTATAGIVLALGATVLATVIPATVLAGGLRKIATTRKAPSASGNSEDAETPALLGLRMGWHLIRLSLLEGGSFAALALMFLEPTPWLIGAAAVPLAILIALFPNQGQVEAWLDEDRQRVRSMNP